MRETLKKTQDASVTVKHVHQVCLHKNNGIAVQWNGKHVLCEFPPSLLYRSTQGCGYFYELLLPQGMTGRTKDWTALLPWHTGTTDFLLIA